MNQFLVPQFIDVEPTIIGPITVRQFLIMIAGFLLVFLEYKLLDFWTFVFAMVITLTIFGIFAFMRVNGQPFHYFVINIIETLKRPSLRIWKKELSDQELKEYFSATPAAPVAANAPAKRRLSRSGLEDLALVVNTGGAYQASEEIKEI
ncbi:MAG: PrgI family protein [Patescibacteria group bacterium]|jgi:hypothetical protein